MIGGTQILASYIGGLLWDNIDPAATFYFGTVLSAASVILLFILLPSKGVRPAEVALLHRDDKLRK